MKINFSRTLWSKDCRRLYGVRLRRLYRNFWMLRIEFWRYSFTWDIFK